MRTFKVSASVYIEPVYYAVSGVTVDTMGEAKAGVTVNLNDESESTLLTTTSDDSGKFAFGSVEAGSYKLKGKYWNYVYGPVSVSVSTADVTDVNLVMKSIGKK